MTLSDLSMSDWVRMSDEIARRECETLAQALPQGLKFVGLSDHTYCGRTHRVARFCLREAGDPAYFVLLPGGDVSLGFDGARFKPRPWQIEFFREWPAELVRRGVDVRYVKFSIHDFVDNETSAPRSATLLPTLMEVEAKNIAPREDVIPLSRSDPEFKTNADLFDARLRATIDPDGKIRTFESRSGNPCDSSTVVTFDANFDCIGVSHRPPTTIRIVQERLAQTGMRLPTCDEWEHACGAGASTLFRWGDDTPDDHYPDDTCAEDRELKRASTLSLGRIKYETPPPGWNLHDQPNLYGLRIASNPYRMDVVADQPWVLGGDGGNHICGGSGFFLGWLPLATAYRDSFRDRCFSPETYNVANNYHGLRRVIPII